jgi:predicted ABC-type ATPase
LLLAGPKGVGKSWVSQLAEREFAVHYVDADLLILALLEKGASPDPEDGWLAPVQAVVFDALARYRAVSAEITGGWDSDCRLARNVEQRGYRVLKVLLSAPTGGDARTSSWADDQQSAGLGGRGSGHVHVG